MTYQHVDDAGVDQDFRAWQVAVDAYASDLWNLALDTGLSEPEAASACDLVWLRLLEAIEGGLLHDRRVSLSAWIVQTLLLESRRGRQLASWRASAAPRPREIPNATWLSSEEDQCQ